MKRMTGAMFRMIGWLVYHKRKSVKIFCEILCRALYKKFKDCRYCDHRPLTIKLIFFCGIQVTLQQDIWK